MEIQEIILANQKKFKYLYANYHNGKQFLYFHGFAEDDRYMIKNNEKAFYCKANYWIIKEIA
jgi:hypothetical protein